MNHMTAPTLLKVTGLKVAYGGIQAVKGVSFEVHQGELVSLIGANGAGKTTTREALTGANLPPDAVHYENFTPDASLAPADDASGLSVDRDAALATSLTETINVRLRGERISVPYTKGDTVLDAGRRASISPPFACESGICGACIAFLRDGEVAMVGGARSLAADEAEAGWILACRAIPQTPTIEIEFPA